MVIDIYNIVFVKWNSIVKVGFLIISYIASISLLKLKKYKMQPIIVSVDKIEIHSKLSRKHSKIKVVWTIETSYLFTRKGDNDSSLTLCFSFLFG